MSDWRDELRDPGCEICPLHEGAQHVCLMGSGPPRAKIMVVGQNPGEREDDENRAFVGKAGKLLDLALEQYAGIDRDECHVTNVVKCHTPKNAAPDRRNVKACVESYFWDEVAHVKPHFMLVLGNSALQGVLKASGIMKKAGSVWEKQLGGVPVTVMATIHPAAVLRNPKNADLFTADIARFGRLVRGQKSESDTKVKIVRTASQLRWLKSELMQASVISYDIETYTRAADPPYVRTNFQDWHGSDSWIVSISFSWKEGHAAVVPLWHVKTPWKDPDLPLAFLRSSMMREDCKYVGHNCLSGDTEIITRQGVRSLRESEGKLEVWTKRGWKKGIARHYGKSQLVQVELAPAGYRSNIRHYVHATWNHRWPLFDNGLVTTRGLKLGDCIQAAKVAINPSHKSQGFIHGLIFADGSLASKQPNHGKHFHHQIRLCGDKARWAPLFPRITHHPSAGKDPVCGYTSKTNMKELPGDWADAQYIADFLEGWQLLDGTDYGQWGQRDLRNRKEDNIQWVIRHAALAGWYVSGTGSYVGGGFAEGRRLYSVILSKQNKFRPLKWRVKSIVPLIGMHDIFCVEVPGEERFSLASGVYTGNSKFDSRWLHSKGIPVQQTFDTMLAAHMLEENRPKGLKPLSRTLLGVDAYDVGEEGLGAAHRTPLRKLCVYNGKDTDYTLRLYRVFKEQMKQDERAARVFMKLMMPASNALVDIERNGVWIDPDRWQERHDQAQENVSKVYRYINRFVPEDLRPINLRSPPQVGKWLYGHLGMPVLEETKTGNPATKEGVILRLMQDYDHPALKGLLKYRKWAKYLSTYLLPWWYEHRDSNGRIHSNYKLFGTVTGRLSGEGGIQQVPRDPFIRSIIGAPPGWIFLQADYSQIELRIAAMHAHEHNMLRQYALGEDIHMARAMKMTGKQAKDVSKEERKKAKAVNFGYVYGMGARKFVTYSFENYELKITLEEAESDRNGFFEDYPALRPWHQRQRRLARRYGIVYSPLGRARHLPDIHSTDESVQAEAERQAINSPVQSTASDMMLDSLVTIHRQLDPHEAMIVGTVHDSILFQVHEDCVDEIAPLVKDTMEDVQRMERRYKAEITVPIIADIEVGTHWGGGEPWEPGSQTI